MTQTQRDELLLCNFRCRVRRALDLLQESGRNHVPDSKTAVLRTKFPGSLRVRSTARRNNICTRNSLLLDSCKRSLVNLVVTHKSGRSEAVSTSPPDHGVAAFRARGFALRVRRRLCVRETRPTGQSSALPPAVTAVSSCRASRRHPLLRVR